MIAGFTVRCEEKTIRFISRAWSVREKVVLKSKNPLIDPLTRETMKKEIRNVRRSLVFIVTCEEKR